MGNCLGRSPRGRGIDGEHCAKDRAVWTEEKAVASDNEKEKETCKGECGTPPPPPAPATDQVRIRITRKQLELLLRRVGDGKQDGDGGGVPVREVISELLSCSSNFRRRRVQGQWRPTLQSIPE